MGTTTITITGGSDDLIEIDGCVGGDEFCNPKSDSPVKFVGNLIAPDGTGIRVHVLYDDKGLEATGCWSAALGLLREGEEFPDWPVKISNGDRSYNTLVTIEAPEGTRLEADSAYAYL